MDLGKQNYTRTRGLLLQQELLGRMQAVPGVDAAAFAFTLPLNDSRWEEGIRREGDATRVQTFQNSVSPRYFDVMRIPLVAGRVFSDGDSETAPPVAIVNQTLARALWPDDSPIGRRVTANGRSVEVVGVMRDIKGRNLLEAASPILFLPLAQAYQSNVVLHVRSTVPPMSLVEPLRRELHALDADLPFYGVSTMDQHVTATLTPQRLLAYLVGGFGLVALLLAAIGLYGLLAYSVSQRTPEIGLRMALGASKADVLRMFVGGAMRVTLIGLAAGCVVAVGVTPLMKSVLFGVSPLDPLTVTTATGLLLLAAIVASAMPARRAAGADPKEALRYE
jgi:predicted permease